MSAVVRTTERKHHMGCVLLELEAEFGKSRE